MTWSRFLSCAASTPVAQTKSQKKNTIAGEPRARPKRVMPRPNRREDLGQRDHRLLPYRPPEDQKSVGGSTKREFILLVGASVLKDPALSLEERGFYMLLRALADARSGEIPPMIKLSYIERLAACSRHKRERL